MGNRPQQVGAKLFFFCFSQKLFCFINFSCLIFHAEGGGTGQNRNEVHDHKGEGISGHSKAELAKRISKQVIYEKNTDNTRDNTISVFVRVVGNHNNRQDVNQRHIGRTGRIDMVVDGRNPGSQRHGPNGKEQTEMGMKGMGARNSFHKIGEQFPDIIFQKQNLLWSDDQHFSSVFILKGPSVQQGTDGFIKMICIELFRWNSSLGKGSDHGQIPMSTQFFQQYGG